MIPLPREQQICTACGLCCDGTLFAHAVLRSGELANLPEKMVKQYFTTEKGEFFRLPCPYFKKKCSIYYKQKAHVCSSFRCRLLFDLNKQEITPADALKIIGNARIQLEEIHMLAHLVLNVSEKLPLTGIQEKLRCMEPDRTDTSQMKILIARSTILEALLTRHFKTDSEFAAMKVPAGSLSQASEHGPLQNKHEPFAGGIILSPPVVASADR
jgi:hypothetical protein